MAATVTIGTLRKYWMKSQGPGLTHHCPGLFRMEFVIPFKDEGPMIIDFANDKRPIFDGDRSFNKLNKWVEDNLKYPVIFRLETNIDSK